MISQIETPDHAAVEVAERKALPFVDLRVVKPEPAALQLAPGDFAIKHQVLPICMDKGTLVAAIASEASLAAIDSLGILLDQPVRAVLADASLIQGQIEERFIQKILSDLPAEDGGLTEIEENADLADLQKMASDAAVIQMLNFIFSQAVREGASDIHIEPYEREVRVRYRVDGIMHERAKPPKRMHAALVSRVKILGQMNIAERRLPQDGRIKLQVAGRAIDVRVAIVPTMYGERAVMRILDKSNAMLGMEALGMGADALKSFRKMIRQPHGMILSTGPTGSGKSTTLYGVLQELASPRTNIVTIEDPVEYQLYGIGQIQVRPQIGLSFANGLRSIVRQDPDIIMVGEIRDEETAEIAIHAALTGHMVLSTLHTNDAAGAITRLLDMGVEPFLAASSIIGILGQRLVRKNCSACSTPSQEEATALRAVNITAKELQGHTFMRGMGCDKCQGTGFKGRTGLFEWLTVDETVRRMTTERASASTIKKYATESLGMRTLLEDGKRIILEGTTTPEEVLRVCQSDIDEDNDE